MLDLLTRAKSAWEENSLILSENIIKNIPRGTDEYIQGQKLLAQIAFSTNRFNAVIDLLNPLEKDEEMYFALAAANQSLGNQDEATKMFKTAGTIHGDFSAAMAYMASEKWQEAYNILNDLNDKHANDVAILFSLASVARTLGSVDESIEYLKKVVEIDPGCVLAYINLMGVVKYTEDLFPIETLEYFIDSVSIDQTTEALVNNALGKCYENLGDYDKSFDFYSKGNNIIRKTFPDDVCSVHDVVANNVVEKYTSQMLNTFKTDKECPLVFIFGMPRSGSTLVEQVLVNNPDISTQGETANVEKEISNWLSKIQNGVAEESFNKDNLGDEYLKLRVGDLDSKMIIDKMPANFNYIGLMYMLFPNAKFIYTKRNKADVCLSGWSTMYSSGHPYSYTLEEMNREYDAHEKIVNHWLSVMPEGSIHTVQYESMVNDFDNEVNSLCEYLDITIVQEMKEFHKLKRRVHTASVGQVTEPLYNTSVNRASKFGKKLEIFK